MLIVLILKIDVNNIKDIKDIDVNNVKDKDIDVNEENKNYYTQRYYTRYYCSTIAPNMNELI